MGRICVSITIFIMVLTVASCSLFEVRTNTMSTNTFNKPSSVYRGTATLAFAWGERLSPPQTLTRALINLQDAVIKYSDISTTLNPNLRLSSDDLFNTSFLLVAASQSFDLTVPERENLRRYLMNGGFILLDNVQPVFEGSQSEASMRKMMEDTLGSQARFQKIPESHEIYHMVFDFDVPPMGAEVGVAIQRGDVIQIRSEDVNYLEGIWIGDRLVAVLSNKGYVVKWNESETNDAQLRFGVNLVIYALQSGGIGSIDRQDMEY